jgi:CheY-like chemotaxis protein
MKKILIVEDQAEARKMLNAALKKTGYMLMEASNGLAALEQVRDYKPEIVLLDIVMPGQISGFQACEWIKAEADLKDTFVILMSGLSDPKDFEEARRVGANAYLVKPFRLSRLVEIVLAHEKMADTFVLETMP